MALNLFAQFQLDQFVGAINQNNFGDDDEGSGSLVVSDHCPDVVGDVERQSYGT